MMGRGVLVGGEEEDEGVQNVYDDPVFFEGYKRVWSQPNPYNDGIERPALLSLLPPPEQWHRLSFLDLGCGTPCFIHFILFYFSSILPN
jgi:hypothetical protein